MHDIVAADLMGQRRPYHGMVAIGSRQADDADRHAEELVHQVGLDGVRPLQRTGLEKGQRRHVGDDGHAGGAALVAVDERAVQIGHHGQKARQRGPGVDPRDLGAVLVDHCVERLQPCGQFRRGLFTDLYLLFQLVHQARQLAHHRLEEILLVNPRQKGRAPRRGRPDVRFGRQPLRPDAGQTAGEVDLEQMIVERAEIAQVDPHGISPSCHERRLVQDLRNCEIDL